MTCSRSCRRSCQHWGSDLDRETLDVDVLIVGGGPAGLSAALRLATLQKADGGESLAIAVLEKARESGAHMLSGAVLDPAGLDELIPDWRARGAPLDTAVCDDRVYYLTRTRKLRFPITPPPLRNHGNYVISLNRFVKWLTEQVEAEGVDVFTGFAGAEVLFEGSRVVGVRTGDRGVDRHGARKPTFEPGVDIRAKVTIFAEGVRGSLTKTLIRRFSLDAGRLPQGYSIGIKELWEIPADRVRPGSVIHTMGYPLRHEEYGGGFIYALADGRLSVGFVAGLDYRDPLFDPHVAFQRFKQHPLVTGLLAGGQMIRYGAKAIPMGGWHAVPRSHMDGALIIGDAAGLLNALRLKGLHLAIRSGVAAAEATFEAVRANDLSARRLQRYTTLVESGSIREELYPVRNVHQSFAGGLLVGLMYSGLALVTRGWWIRDPMPAHAGHQRLQSV
ncbi:MAG: NAD(P)/FAD-dependent oxidoreductase, partial [Vicinamibacterales bacterium]